MSQVTFIYVALLTIQIVSKHLTVSNWRIVSLMYNNKVKHSIFSLKAFQNDTISPSKHCNADIKPPSFLSS